MVSGTNQGDRYFNFNIFIRRYGQTLFVTIKKLFVLGFEACNLSSIITVVIMNREEMSFNKI